MRVAKGKKVVSGIKPFLNSKRINSVDFTL